MINQTIIVLIENNKYHSLNLKNIQCQKKDKILKQVKKNKNIIQNNLIIVLKKDKVNKNSKVQKII